MKNLLLLFSLLVVIPMAGCEYVTGPKEQYEKLPVDGKTFEVKSFKAIQADGVFNVILSQGDKESVVVKGELPKGLKIYNSGDTLVIIDTCKIHSARKSIQTDVYITLKDVDDIYISSVGETTCSDTLKLKKLNFHCEGVGTGILWVNADTVIMSEEGVGKLTIAGKAAFAKIDDSGVGALLAKEFKVDVLHVNVSGVGASKVYANKEIYLESSGVGGVEYSGPAKVMQNESSGVGQVQHVD